MNGQLSIIDITSGSATLPEGTDALMVSLQGAPTGPVTLIVPDPASEANPAGCSLYVINNVCGQTASVGTADGTHGAAPNFADTMILIDSGSNAHNL